MFNENIIFVIQAKNFKLLGDKNIKFFFYTWHQSWKKIRAVWDARVALLHWPLLRRIEAGELRADLRRALRVLKYFYWSQDILVDGC